VPVSNACRHKDHIHPHPFQFTINHSSSFFFTRGASTRRLRDHTHCTHHTRQDSSGRVVCPLQRPLPDNMQHSQETDIDAPGGIRTHTPSKQAATDRRLRPRAHQHRHFNIRRVKSETLTALWNVKCTEKSRGVVKYRENLTFSVSFHLGVFRK